MGAADVVPGVSGGTVALVLGIYERLVSNIHEGSSVLGRLLKGNPQAARDHLKRVEWLFLIPLLTGIGAAVLSLAHVIEVALADHPVPMGALFMGLVAASAVVAWRLLDHVTVARVVVMVVAAVATFFVLGLTAGERQDASMVLVFAAGALAICAMILPGVSGSFLLLAIGMYEFVLGAVSDRELAVVAVFASGCVVGLAVFSSALNWTLAHHRDTVLAVLTGLMIGSLRVLWPWPVGTEETGLAAPGEQAGLAAVVALAAGALVLVVAEFGRRREASHEEAAPSASGTPQGPATS
jgi:putative membrane protein